MNATPLELFRSGLDTLAIAERLGGITNGWTEARVYNAIAKEKKLETADGSFMSYPVYNRAPLIRYAGYDRTTMPWSGQR